MPYPNQTGLLIPLTIYYGNGDGTFQTPALFPMSYAYTQVAVADINQDKKPDLILSDGSGIAAVEGQGNRIFGAEQHLVAGQNISGLTVTNGSVTFLDGGSVLGSSTTDITGTASFVLPVLASGAHNLFAAFSGTPAFAPSVSPALVEQIPSARVGFALRLSSQSVDLTLSLPSSVLITITPASGFNGNVHLSCASGLPSGYQCLFSPGTLPGGISELQIGRRANASKLRPRLYFFTGTVGIFCIVCLATLGRRRDLLIFLLALTALAASLSCGSSPSPLQKQISILSIRATEDSGINAIIQSAQLVVLSK